MTFLDLFLVPGLAHHNDHATWKCGPDFMDTRVAQRIRQGQIKQDKIRDSVLRHQAGKASNTVYAVHLEMAMELVQQRYHRTPEQRVVFNDAAVHVW